ncbi:hypothetical protein C1645_809136 [Glomus cerebriforme]|uniref:DUF8211 domain-containing protein n=1 Tax=Glomus cerebriforme TaxID=658196 RepID=A0A397SCB2_9GLOM|nr:hypothetical protein C1645_809136 [Glomus cerebriforme]
MSNRRTGCSFHQNRLNIDITSNDQSPHSKHAAAATLTYQKYCSATVNHIYNNRLGTSYNTQITLINKQWASSHNVPFTYQKKYFNYHVTTSSPSCTYSTRTLKHQLSRRNRLIRHLFNRENLSYDSTHIPGLVTSIGHKYHYILDSQHSSYHFIKHIKFKKFLQKSSKLFPLPRAWSYHTHIPRLNSITKLENCPDLKVDLQDPSPDLSVTIVTTHTSNPPINDIVIPQELDTPLPHMSRSAQKKLANLERKRQKESEALQHRIDSSLSSYYGFRGLSYSSPVVP